MLLLATVCVLGCAEDPAGPAGPDIADFESGLTGPIVKVLPDLESISKIEVFALYDEDGKILERFQAPKEYWQEILQALSPARFDPDPAEWIILGYLDIELKDGTIVPVHLYHTYEEVGAFSVEKNEHERPYYRGGNSDKLSNILHKAYAAREAH